MIYLKITKKPIRTLMKVDGIAVVENQKYPLEVLTNVSLHNETIFLGEPFDSFKYKIYNELMESVNEATVKVSFATDKTGLPQINALVKELDLYGSFNFSDIVTPENKYDRVVITSITGRGSWRFNNQKLEGPGQEFFLYELPNNLKFIADVPGVMENYSILTWDTKNLLGPHGQENTINVNSTSLGAELILNSSSSVADVEAGVETLTYTFFIKKSIVDAAYKIDVDPTLFPSLGTNPLDTITLTERSFAPVVIDTAGTSTITSTLDTNGETEYTVIIKKETDTTAENSVTINLTEVNADPLKVNALSNSIVLIIPIT